MNIIEAVKSGRPFKRKCHAIYLYPDVMANRALYGVSFGDIIADDWEIEPEPVQKIELGWGEIEKELNRYGFGGFHAIDSIKARLGFK